MRSVTLNHYRYASGEWGPVDAVDEMALAAGVPDADRADVVAYVREQIAGLHEGNVIRYRLKPDDLEGVNLR